MFDQEKIRIQLGKALGVFNEPYLLEPQQERPNFPQSPHPWPSSRRENIVPEEKLSSYLQANHPGIIAPAKDVLSEVFVTEKK